MILYQMHNSKGDFNYNANLYRDIHWIPHLHKNFELLFACRGKTEVTVGSKTVSIDENTAFLIFPYMVHSFTVPKDSLLWVGVFSEDFIGKFAAKHANCGFCKTVFDGEIRDFLKKQLFFSENPSNYIKIACLNLVCDACEIRGTYENTNYSAEILFKIIDYVGKNYTKELTMRSAAEALGYEYHYFSKLFHDCFSVNFKHFVNVNRMEEACRLLLEEKNASITQIAAECGFQTIRSFNRCFKEMLGITPADYRKQSEK